MIFKIFLLYPVLYICLVTVFHFGASMANDGDMTDHGAPIQIVPSHVAEDLHAKADPEAQDVQAGVDDVAVLAEEAEAASSQQAAATGYKLGAGDKVRISVYDEPDLSREYAVSDKGTISMPLVGDLEVAGKTVMQIQSLIRARLSEGYLKNPDVAIEVSKFRPIYIMGEVKNPGSYAYVADMTVLNAVVIAGGYTYRADDDDHEIMRQSAGETQVYKDAPETLKVLPGDIILVKERFF